MADERPNLGGRPPLDGEAAMSWIQLRTTQARKGAYVRAANGRKLSEWVFEHLDKAAGYKPNGKHSEMR